MIDLSAYPSLISNVSNGSIIPVPVATFVVDPNYSFLIIFNFLVSIVGLMIFNLRDKVDFWLKEADIKLNYITIIEVLFRMLILFNVGVFLFHFFTPAFFGFNKMIYHVFT